MGRVSGLCSVLLVGVLLAACSPLMDGAARTAVTVTVVYADLDTINQVARERGYHGQAYGFLRSGAKRAVVSRWGNRGRLPDVRP